MTKQYDLDISHTIDGLWWVPGKENAKVAGKLVFDPKDGTRLTLIGTLLKASTKDPFADFFGGFGDYEQINGETMNGKAVVLRQCFTTVFSRGNEELFVNAAIVGESSELAFSAAVSEVSLETTNLKAWTAESPLSCDITAIAKNEPGPIINYSPIGDSAIAGRLEASSADLTLTHHVVVSSDLYSESADYRAFFCLQFDKPRTFGETRDIAGQLEMLMSLLIGKPAYAQWQTLGFDNNCDGHLLATRWANAKTREVPHPMMLCPLPAIRDVFCTVLDNWLAMTPQLRMIMKLLFSCLYKANTFLEVDFADCAHALDSFASIDHNGPYISPGAFDSLSKKMLELIKGEPVSGYKELRERAKSTFEHLNEPSMRRRLKRLLASVNATIVSNCIGEASFNRFIDYVVTVRNRLAHPSGEDIWSMTNVDELGENLGRLKLLLIVLLLQSVGIPEAILESRYNDYRQWQWG